MMTLEQYLLTKLAEEAAEISQIALKTAQFGVHERYKPSGLTNIQRVEQEYNDLIAIVSMLKEECNIVIKTDEDKIKSKKSKVFHYLNYSRNLCLTEF